MDEPIAGIFALTILKDDRTCLAHAQEEEWGGISNALQTTGRGPEALLASRVNAQIRLCTARLEQLSKAYEMSLVVASFGDWRASLRSLTSNKYAYHIASEYRSLLNELYALRDAILAVCFRIVFERTDSYSTRKMKTLTTADSGMLSSLIVDSMFNDDGDLLIDRMSLYRSVAMHCMGSTNPIFGDCYKLMVSEGPFGDLPYLVFPLYDDFEKMRAIERGASQGLLERPSRKEAERFLRMPAHVDALEFCFDCYERLLRISELAACEVGIEPEVLTITDKDILEAKFTDEKGEVTRFRRDKDTGQLESY